MIGGEKQVVIPQDVLKMKRKPAPILIPKFGPLEGLRVLSTSSVIAGPFCASLFGWFGAEVIHVENPGVGDAMRTLPPKISRGDKTVSSPWANEATNRLSIVIDLRLNKKPASREIFYGLIKQSDFWIENMVWLEQRYGITDKEVFEVNPKIIIVHVSGYGHPEFGGEEKKCLRASYDMIGQCYSGWPNLIGPKDAPPSRASPWTGDYCAAMTAFYGALMAHMRMLKDGKGQVVDVSQYEALARNFCESYFCTYLNTGQVMSRGGNKSVGFQPYSIFEANDGWVAIGTLGPGTYKKFIECWAPKVNLDPTEYSWEETSSSADAVNSEKGLKLDSLLKEWVAARSGKEVEDFFNDHSVPCTRVYTPEMAASDPHWIDRENFVEVEDQILGEKIWVTGIHPKFSRTPGKIWRGAPSLAQDREAILKQILGYSDDKIKDLVEKKVFSK